MKLNTSELALFGILGGLIFALKVAMMGLPNIEPTSLLVMLYAVLFGRKSVFPITVYILLEFALYGLNIWSVSYLYIWFLLALAAWYLRDMQSPLGWAMLSGIFGLLFGALCTPACLFVGGPAYAFSWWVNGISFDLIHCAANFTIALILFCPLRRLGEQLYRKKF